MTTLRAALLMFAAAGPAAAADLGHIDRAIKKEPAYQTKAPGYLLLAFGPEARDRVWLVRDGDVLYADRNGNGDLTEPGERITAEKSGADRAFHAGTVRCGGREHRHLVVRTARLSDYGDSVLSHPVSKAALRKDKDAELVSVSVEVEVPGLTGGGDGGRLQAGARFDSDGPLLFGDSPAAAPVVHFGGPLRLRTEDARPTLYRSVVHDLMLTVGTPGAGPGTFAHLGYDKLVPGGAFLVAEAEFPPARPGDPPVRQRFELKERC
jgi:hypothetical protein